MPTGQVLTQEITKNRDGEKDVRLLNVIISDLDDIQKVELFTQAGDDAAPPIGSTVFIVKAGDAYKIAVACDDGVVPTANPGERIIYASVAGAIICQIYLQLDGTIEISNQVGKIEMSPTGQVNINNGNLTVDP